MLFGGKLRRRMALRLSALRLATSCTASRDGLVKDGQRPPRSGAKRPLPARRTVARWTEERLPKPKRS